MIFQMRPNNAKKPLCKSSLHRSPLPPARSPRALPSAFCHSSFSSASPPSCCCLISPAILSLSHHIIFVNIHVGNIFPLLVFLPAVLIPFARLPARLEYKYSRLVMSANKECELPGADSCAVMEGENEADMEDEVVYTKPSLLGKLKAIASKVSGTFTVRKSRSEKKTKKKTPIKLY